jgi:hypothetical protein
MVPSLQTAGCRHSAKRQQNLYAVLFRRERFVKPRFTTIGCVAMNNSGLGRFIDSGNRRANLIGTAL